MIDCIEKTEIIVKCPFGHRCEFLHCKAIWKCTKCNQCLSEENFMKWMTGKQGIMDEFIWIPVPKLVFNPTELAGRIQ